MRYLTRYLTGGPISDRRILSADRRGVTILAREGVRRGGDRAQVPVAMTLVEFTRRWCLHIQPDGLTKVRYFGGWCPRRRKDYMDHCREILEAIRFDPSDWEEPEPGDGPPLAEGVSTDEPDDDGALHRCPSCQSDALRLIAETPKASWDRVLDHLDRRCPCWHAAAEKASLSEYLEREYGIDYDTWLLETRLESAREPLEPPAAIQLFFPAFYPPQRHLVESG